MLFFNLLVSSLWLSPLSFGFFVAGNVWAWLVLSLVRRAAVRLSPSMIKLREEADPFSMDLGVLKSGEVVKVLEVRLARRGDNEGMLITLD